MDSLHLIDVRPKGSIDRLRRQFQYIAWTFEIAYASHVRRLHFFRHYPAWFVVRWASQPIEATLTTKAA